MCRIKVDVIFVACHASPVGGHNSGVHTAVKVLQSVYYWQTLYQYANSSVKKCV